MSAAQQGKAKRRQMRNGYAHLGGSLKRPSVAGMKFRTVKEAIQAATRTALRMAQASKGK